MKNKEFSDQGLYVPKSILKFDNSSHFLLNVYALNKNRYSSMKEHLAKIEPATFFESLEENLKNDIKDHYTKAIQDGCKEVIWSNEGLYLLNSTEEYQRLYDLFSEYSDEITCICCFREINSYRQSYMNQLLKQKLSFSEEKDSYKYIAEDSWLFDYERKKRLLKSIFKDNVEYLDYDVNDMVNTFISKIGYLVIDNEGIRLNISKI